MPKILVVDDEKMLTELLVQHFRDKGYIAYEANSGKEALEKLSIKPDLILLDINMPDMDGMTLCKSGSCGVSDSLSDSPNHRAGQDKRIADRRR